MTALYNGTLASTRAQPNWHQVIQPVCNTNLVIIRETEKNKVSIDLCNESIGTGMLIGIRMDIYREFISFIYVFSDKSLWAYDSLLPNSIECRNILCF